MLLHLEVGAKISLALDNGRLVIKPQARPHYALDKLLTQCDTAADFALKDRQWLDAKPVGGELL
ncbi:MAG TPA: antitoxin [Advenella kashmirensis]|uniref:Antitoxin n=1 Tax=Advenella kashmirensis TaxID=310575 RepID=A0A356LGQ2_9BURK|nr:antitoxin [Advenella kashmirensis]